MSEFKNEEYLGARTVNILDAVDIICEDEFMPSYQTKDSAGFDFMAAIEEPIVINPGQIVLVPTGVKMALNRKVECQIRPRSGLAFKHGISLVNTPGTIDADYRGEIKCIMINHGSEPFVITRGMRIAQGIINEVLHAEFFKRESLDETERGVGGFGHTGN